MTEPAGNNKAKPLLRIVEVDPQGADAMLLLREAAIEARVLYPELFAIDTAWPSNPPTPDRGVYLVGYLDGKAVACGALRPIDAETVEVRRMFVTVNARRMGFAGAILQALESRAANFGYRRMQLETGNRQLSAMILYEKHGFTRIPPFGEYVAGGVSVCFEKAVCQAEAGALRADVDDDDWE